MNRETRRVALEYCVFFAFIALLLAIGYNFLLLTIDLFRLPPGQ